MNNVLAITGRNLRIFVRDPLTIFFSLLSALIVYLLYTLFLGDLQVASIIDRVPLVPTQLTSAASLTRGCWAALWLFRQ